MARRRIGDALVVLAYVATREGRDVYAGRVSVPSRPWTRDEPLRAVWRFDDLRSPAGGVPDGRGHVHAADAPEAYDEMARAAVTFATAVGRDEVDDLPPEARERREATACAIEEATAAALREDGCYDLERR